MVRLHDFAAGALTWYPRLVKRTAAWPRVLLVTPPFTQLNTPYPATAYLTALLGARGVPVEQADLSLETALRLFCRDGLSRLFAAIRKDPATRRAPRPEVERALAQERRYLDTIDPVIALLQGRDPSFATRVCQGDALPEGPRFDAAAEGDDEAAAFGPLATSDRARYLASLYLDDLADLARETVAPHFALSRYGEHLGASAGSYDAIAAALDEPPGLIDALAEEALSPHLDRAAPDLCGFTVPFPGNLYGALRLCQAVRRLRPRARIALGGGYASTELRQLREPRLFDLVDYVVLDDGERPLLALLEHLGGRREAQRLARTFVRQRGVVRFIDGGGEKDLGQAELPAPTYRGLPLDRYLSVLEVLNPMHRLWSEGRWNKLTVAHGCYWKRCTFCDVGLDYIARYDPTPTRALCDRIDALCAETGQSGFHFVDEAAPPLALVEMALELLSRGRTISWWGNIRFEKTFTADVCRLLAASGCIAVTGGLEVASDRLLALIDKGVTVAQAARVARAFADAGVLVHAYLMYGFPTETAADTVDSLELVRQLFAAGAIHSAFFHRFALTVHSPIARDPARFRVRVVGPGAQPFANNDLVHEDPAGGDAERFGPGLRRALWNYLRGRGLDVDVRHFLEEAGGTRRRGGLRPASVAPDAITRALADPAAFDRSEGRLVWIGGAATPTRHGGRAGLSVVGRNEARFIPLSTREASFVADLVSTATPASARPLPSLTGVATAFPGGPSAFARFRLTPAWTTLTEMSLLLLPPGPPRT